MTGDYEIELMAHAIGWPGNYRNYFASSGPDATICDGLVAKGMMTKHNRDWVPEPIYVVTAKGKAAVAKAKNAQEATP